MLFFFPAGVFLSRHLGIVIKINALHPEQDWQYMTNLHPLTVFSTSVFPTVLPVGSYITSPIISESCFSETDSFRKHFTAFSNRLSMWWMLVLSNLIAQRIFLNFISKILRGICTQWKVRKNESEENNKCTLLLALFVSLENVPASLEFLQNV